MACRTTRWNWKTKGAPRPNPSGLRPGRRLRNDKIRYKTLIRTAALIDEAIICGSADSVDYVQIDRELKQRSLKDSVQSIFDAINTWNFPAELIAVAAVDALKIGSWTRIRKEKVIWTAQGIANALLQKYPELSAVQAARWGQAYVAGDQDTQNWIDCCLLSERALRSLVDRRCCVSKIFRHIKRRMTCHWRKHLFYKQCRTLLSNLVVRYVMPQPSQTVQRSSFASAQSQTTLRRRVRRQARDNY